MSTLFSKIIAGEIPCRKIYEDDKTFAFLDIRPESEGHTLVVPKIECDKIYDLPDEYYSALWATAKKLSQHYDKVLGKRVILKVVGTEIPHAHIHVVPLSENYRDGEFIELSDARLDELADQLRLS